MESQGSPTATLVQMSRHAVYADSADDNLDSAHGEVVGQ
jgi:hypothetical protein